MPLYIEQRTVLQALNVVLDVVTLRGCGIMSLVCASRRVSLLV